MTKRPKGAIIGVGELKPTRYSEGKTTLSLLTEAALLAIKDAGISKEDIDGLLVGPQVGETPQHVPATVSEYIGLEPTMSNTVDLGGGATGAGMVWRAAAAIEAGMCETVLCVLANKMKKVKHCAPPLTEIPFENLMFLLVHQELIPPMPY